MVGPAPARLATAGLWLLGLVAPLTETRAQELFSEERRVTELQRRIWDERSGLPSSTVEAITQTPDGYLWIGTRAGLARFDGVRFRIYDRTSSPGLSSDWIRSLERARDGYLWVATQRGVYAFDGETFAELPPSDGTGLEAHDLLELEDGTLWLAAKQGVLRRLPGVSELSEVGDFRNAISLDRDARGRIWIGASDRIIVGDDAGLRTIDLPTEIDGSYLRIVAVAGDNILWLANEPGPRLARLRIDPTSGELSFLDWAPWEGDITLAVEHDTAGRRFVLTDGEGLWRQLGTRWEHLDTSNGLSSDVASAFFEDREGSLWIGTYGGGFVQLAPRPLRSITAGDGLSGSHPTAILGTRDGAVWIGTYGDGLNRVSDTGIQHFHARDGLDNEFPSVLLESQRGDVWIGTCHGVVRWRAGAITTPPGVKGLFGACVYALAEDESGRLWGGSDLGLYQFDARQGRRVDPSFAANVRALLPSPEGLWVGARQGLFRLQGDRVVAVSRLENVPVVTLTSGIGEGVWVGTRGDGLFRILEGDVTRIGLEHGLPSATICSVVASGESVWLSTSRGIVRAEAPELIAAADGRLTRLALERFDLAGGAPSRECSGGAPPSNALVRAGTIWFPTLRGVVGVDPTSTYRNNVAPTVLIESVHVDGRPRSTEALELSAGAQSLSIDFTAPSFVAPELVKLRTCWRDSTTIGSRSTEHAAHP